MEKMYELYLRYDGPVPRDKSYITSPVCWELMIRGYLRAVRINRHNKNWNALPELTALVKEIRQNLMA